MYKERNTAERCINRIKEWRGLAFRFDKTSESYLGDRARAASSASLGASATLPISPRVKM